MGFFKDLVGAKDTNNTKKGQKTQSNSTQSNPAPAPAAQQPPTPVIQNPAPAPAPADPSTNPAPVPVPAPQPAPQPDPNGQPQPAPGTIYGPTVPFAANIVGGPRISAPPLSYMPQDASFYDADLMVELRVYAQGGQKGPRVQKLHEALNLEDPAAMSKIVQDNLDEMLYDPAVLAEVDRKVLEAKRRPRYMPVFIERFGPVHLRTQYNNKADAEAALASNFGFMPNVKLQDAFDIVWERLNPYNGQTTGKRVLAAEVEAWIKALPRADQDQAYEDMCLKKPDNGQSNNPPKKSCKKKAAQGNGSTP